MAKNILPKENKKYSFLPAVSIQYYTVTDILISTVLQYN